jgi:MFS transporter, PPP family, 3-phenylpropionic acid transporter
VVLAGGAWLDVGSIDVLPASMVVMALGALAVALGLPKGAAHAAAVRFRMEIPRGAWAVLGAGFCMSIAHGALYSFFTLHLQGAGYSGSAIGVLWMLGVLAEIAVFAWLPALFRRYALSSILLLSFACVVARFLAIAWLATELWVLVLAQLLHAATFGASHAAMVASIHRLFPSAQARGQSLFSSLAYGAGGAAGALIAGFAWESSGPGLTFTLAALSGLVGAYFAYALRRSGL